MQFSKFFLAAASITSAIAQTTGGVFFTNTDFNSVTAGQPFDIKWANATGSVTLSLDNGVPGNLQPVMTITGGVDGAVESFTWNVPSDLTADTYALEISDLSGGPPNYSIQFQLIGGVTSTSSTASSTASSTSSSASSTSTDSTASTTSTGSTTTSTGTSTASSSSGTKTTNTASMTSQTTSPTTDAPGSAAGLASPLALVFLALAAIMTLN